MRPTRESRTANRESARRQRDIQRGLRRLVYAVERLTDPARTRVDQGLAEGKSYTQIIAEVGALGAKISKNALTHYWRNRWRPQQRRLQWIQAHAQALADALRHTGESDEAVLARKLLFSVVLDRMKEEVGEADFFQLLRESRELTKATRAPRSRSPAPLPPLSSEEVQRKVREIYGWPQEELPGNADKET
jgi:hypothetical protein